METNKLSDKSQKILKEIIENVIHNPQIEHFNLDKNTNYPYYCILSNCSTARGGFVNEEGIHKLFMEKLDAGFEPANCIVLYDSNTLKEVQATFDLKINLKCVDYL